MQHAKDDDVLAGDTKNILCFQHLVRLNPAIIHRPDFHLTNAGTFVGINVRPGELNPPGLADIRGKGFAEGMVTRLP